MTSRIDIRQADYADLFRLEALLAAGAAEASPEYPINYQRPAVYHRAIDLISLGGCFVAEAEISPDQWRTVGTIMLDVRSMPWAPQIRFLETEHFYVDPDFRSAKTSDGKLIAKALIDIAKSIADSSGAQLRVIGFFGPDQADVKGRLMEQSGLTYMGSTYCYTPQRAASEDKRPEAAE